MTFTKVALTVAAAAVATNFILKSQSRRGPDFADTVPGPVDMNEALDGAYGTDGTDAAGDADASTAPTAVASMGDTGASGAGAGVGAESPNDAERLEATGLGTAPQAGVADDQFKSTPQETPYARAPGLPDFFRGA